MSSATASATGLLTSTSPARRNHPAGRFWERVADPLYAAFVVILLGTAVIAIIYPLYFVVIASISDPNQIYEGNVWLWPKGITFEGYARMFSTSTVIRGFANSLLYTVVGATILVCSILGAGYALSRRTLPFRRTIMAAFIVTMFFDGGMIARYLVVRELGMLNTMWAVVLPGAIGVTNLVIARTFFSTTIPEELHEAAELDGSSELRYFFQIVLPLSKALIMLLVVTHAVAYWNQFFDAMIYLNDEMKYPLQLVLRTILIQSDASGSGLSATGMDSYAESQRIAELMKYGMIVVSTFPLLAALPFAHKYFAQGAMIGAVKS
ncbi:MAG: carbohydrate ABC transporter permease [Actinomyces urogenitalis]|uniref:carbohydrate ABC transporter permease n=1 Tax=Actinomyces urogenitalis TaxID=103621 RepID=UPI0005104A13|nr:carbohydrate ABC transporter permease [Actinomyces urogenitalis]KGF02458.1 sugar ABC transporter permease [Actinomyces urogenitalis S6-C4]MDU5874921.1 carbohydrate ABC transporter permease [Actinomyces urogenitalis]